MLAQKETTTLQRIYTLFEESEIASQLFVKSPFNYIGNKFKLLRQIIPLFPKDISTFYDLFCGGLDVSINVVAEHKVANDINHFVIEIFQYFKENSNQSVRKDIYKIIKDHNLSKDNKEAYYEFRDYYNNNKHPLLLFVLVSYSFNHQFRFNANLDFNNPAGTNRSAYNASIERRLTKFQRRLHNITFTSQNFKSFDYSLIEERDFVYMDPPYLASVGSYNDGKRGFDGWRLEDDLILFNILDKLNERGIKFALSNVFENNGQENRSLKRWSEKYSVHFLDIDYSNSNYQKKNEGKSVEVLITNY